MNKTRRNRARRRRAERRADANWRCVFAPLQAADLYKNIVARLGTAVCSSPEFVMRFHAIEEEHQKILDALRKAERINPDKLRTELVHRTKDD